MKFFSLFRLLLRTTHTIPATTTITVVWIMSFLGITYQLLYHEKYKLLEVCFYITVGLFPAIVIIDMVWLFFFLSFYLSIYFFCCLDRTRRSVWNGNGWFYVFIRCWFFQIWWNYPVCPCHLALFCIFGRRFSLLCCLQLFNRPFITQDTFLDSFDHRVNSLNV